MAGAAGSSARAFRNPHLLQASGRSRESTGSKAQASRQALWAQRAKSRRWPGEKSQRVGSPGVPGAVSKKPSFQALCIWEGRTLSRHAGWGLSRDSRRGREQRGRDEGRSVSQTADCAEIPVLLGRRAAAAEAPGPWLRFGCKPGTSKHTAVQNRLLHVDVTPPLFPQMPS